jgi:hypothetical protein
MYAQRARITILVYDEAELERVFETKAVEAGVGVIPGAVATAVEREGDRLQAVSFATRFGPLVVRAPLFIDASGDAVSSWLAGAPCRVSDPSVYGTQMAVLEQVTLPPGSDTSAVARRAEQLLQEYAERYRLTRRESRVFLLPQRGLAVLNATHLSTPLYPVAFWQEAWPAQAEAERAAQLLREHTPRSSVGRAYVSWAIPASGRPAPSSRARP